MVRDHQCRLFAVNHAQEAWHSFAPLTCGADIDQQLREHQQRRGWCFFRFKPDFAGLDIDQPFENAFQAKRRDIGVLDVFLGPGLGKRR